MRNNFLKTTLVPAGVIVATFLAACGEYQKNPVSDLKSIRDTAKVNVDAVKPPVQLETKYIPQEIRVVVAENSIDGKSVIVSAPKALVFHEGVTSSFPITAKSTKQGVDITLVGKSLPEGATLTASKEQKDQYILTWTPELNTIPYNEDSKDLDIKLSVEVLDSSTDKEAAAKLKNLLYTESTLSMTVKPNKDALSAIAVTQPKEVIEGQIVPITLVVTIPGVNDKSTQKPAMLYWYDNQAVSAGSNTREENGTLNLAVDPSQPAPKYLGDSKWEFKYVIDTKNIQIPLQRAKDGSVVEQADGTNVRMSFKAMSPRGGISAPAVVQVKLKYNGSKFAPKFEALGLAGKTSFEISRGDDFTMKFTITSIDSSATTTFLGSDSKLVGQPQVACEASSVTASIQNCVLTWKVPCDVKREDVQGHVVMKAVSKTAFRSSEETVSSFTFTAAKSEKNTCAVIKAAADKAAKAVKDAEDKAKKEIADKEAKEKAAVVKAEKDAADKAAKDKAAVEKAEKAAAAQEAKAKADAEKAAKAATDKAAKDKAAAEKAEKAAADKEAKAKADAEKAALKAASSKPAAKTAAPAVKAATAAATGATQAETQTTTQATERKGM